MPWFALPQTKDSDAIWQGLSQNSRVKIAKGASPRRHAETSPVNVKDIHLMNKKLPPAEILCGDCRWLLGAHLTVPFRPVAAQTGSEYVWVNVKLLWLMFLQQSMTISEDHNQYSYAVAYLVISTLFTALYTATGYDLQISMIKFEFHTGQELGDKSLYRTNASSCMVYWKFVYFSTIVPSENISYL